MWIVNKKIHFVFKATYSFNPIAEKPEDKMTCLLSNLIIFPGIGGEVEFERGDLSIGRRQWQEIEGVGLNNLDIWKFLSHKMNRL